MRVSVMSDSRAIAAHLIPIARVFDRDFGMTLISQSMRTGCLSEEMPRA